MRVTLYTRTNCSLCDDLKADLTALQSRANFDIVEFDIETDAEILDRFQYLIPVLEIEGGPILYPPHHWDILVEELDRATGSTT